MISCNSLKQFLINDESVTITLLVIITILLLIWLMRGAT